MLKISYGPQIDDKNCNRCGKCYEICPMDVFTWDQKEGRPEISYPGECRFCGYCEMGCPQLAIDIRFPLHAMLNFGIEPSQLKK